MKRKTEKLFGRIQKCYFSYSVDEHVRFSASSGGFCKSFLVYLIKYAKVDEVIITRTGAPESPLKPETIITNSTNDILSTRTNSVYSPTYPAKVLNKLDDKKKYAFVGLGCHCRELNELHEKGLALNVVFVIGLLCNHTPYIGFTKKILHKLGITQNEIHKIEYRGNGWPGKFTAYIKDGGTKQIELINYWSNDLNNGPDICKRCGEIATYSDITLGDPWNLGFEKDDKNGRTLVIVRNRNAYKLVIDAEKRGCVILEKCTEHQLLKSQKCHAKEKNNRKEYK